MVDLPFVSFFKVKKQFISWELKKIDHNEFSPVFVWAWLITIANYWFGTKVGRNSVWLVFFELGTALFMPT
jgi:hypothetical protein